VSLEEQRMPYVTTAERRGIEQGRAEGRVEGQYEELLSAIELMLRVRFGAAGLALLPEISQITEYSLLRAIRDQILTVDQPEDLRPIYQQL
jgi:transposase